MCYVLHWMEAIFSCFTVMVRLSRVRVSVRLKRGHLYRDRDGEWVQVPLGRRYSAECRLRNAESCQGVICGKSSAERSTNYPCCFTAFRSRKIPHFRGSQNYPSLALHNRCATDAYHPVVLEKLKKNEKWFFGYSSSMLDCTSNKTLQEAQLSLRDRATRACQLKSGKVLHKCRRLVFEKLWN